MTETITVADITETDTRPAGWWTSEDGQGGYDMSGDTLAQAKRTLLDQCADDEQRAGILAGRIQVLPQTVTLINPFSGATVEHDISGLTEAQLDAYAHLMDDASREATHAAVAPCTPAEFLTAWVERVGPKEAGRVILGS
jgi:hypothetical protein